MTDTEVMPSPSQCFSSQGRIHTKPLRLLIVRQWIHPACFSRICEQVRWEEHPGKLSEHKFRSDSHGVESSSARSDDAMGLAMPLQSTFLFRAFPSITSCLSNCLSVKSPFPSRSNLKCATLFRTSVNSIVRYVNIFIPFSSHLRPLSVNKCTIVSMARFSSKCAVTRCRLHVRSNNYGSEAIPTEIVNFVWRHFYNRCSIVIDRDSILCHMIIFSWFAFYVTCT